MIIWIVQYRKTKRSMSEAKIFKRHEWEVALRYANFIGQYKPYLKPILFQATVRDN